MRYTGMTLSLGLALVVLPGLAASPTGAEETGWRVRVFGALLDPDTSETVVNDAGDRIRVSGDRGFGGGGEVEYRIHRHLGVGGGITVASPKITLDADVPGIGPLSLSDDLTTVVIAGDVLFHLTPGSRIVDLYVGGGIASVAPGSLRFSVLDIEELHVEGEDYVTWSARAGLDVSFGEESGWIARLGVRYVPGDLELRQLGLPADDTVAVGFNLLSFTAGLGYRF